ncbi:MAG: oligosaccharide flippase family protein [Verrucomicrobiia bacterium]
MSGSIDKLLVRSGGSLGLASFFEYGCRFLRTIVLARLLTPDAFGLAAILVACMAVAEALTEVGLREAVVQNRHGGKKEFLNTVWWLSVGRGLLLYAGLWTLAPWVAKTFGQEESVLLLQVGFVVTVLNAATSPALHVLQKDFSFGKWVVLMQVSGVVGVVVAIVLGFMTRHVWSLIAGIVAESLCRCVLSFAVLSFRPTLGLNRNYLKEIMTFSRGMFGLPILMVILLQTDTFVMGKLFSASVLGIYSLARDLADLPNKVLSRVISPLLLPTFSAQQEDLAGMRKRVIMVTELLVALGAPYTLFCLLFAEPYLVMVYGENVAGMATTFSMLSAAILLQILSSVIMNAFIGLGRPQVQRLAALARTISMLVIIYPLARFVGAAGVALAVLCSIMIALTLQVSFARGILGLRLAEYLAPWWTGLRLCIFVIVAWLIVQVVVVAPWVAVLLGCAGFLTGWVIACLRMEAFQRVRAALAR